MRQQVLLILLVVLVFFRYIFNGFVWLDHVDVQQRAAVVDISHFASTFSQPFGATGWYRPVVVLVYSIEYAFYGLNPMGYHITNILLHTGVVLLTYFILRRRLQVGMGWSFLLALFVAWQPGAYVTAGIINNRTDSLAVVFTLLTIWFWRRNWLAGVFCLLAFLSKETALLWIGGYGVVDYLVDRKKHFGAVIAGVIYFCLRQNAVGMQHISPVGHIAWPLRFDIFGRAVVNYLLSPFLPSMSDVVYPGQLSVVFVGIGVLVICGGVGLVLNKRVAILLRIWTAVTLLSLVPFLQFIQLPRLIQPHYAYFSHVALAFLLGVTAKNYLSVRASRWLAFAMCVWVMTSAIQLHKISGQLATDQALFGPQVVVSPDYAEGRFYLAEGYLKSGDVVAAEKEYVTALQSGRNAIRFLDEPSARINLATIYLHTGRYRLGIQSLEQAWSEASFLQRQGILFNHAYALNNAEAFGETIALLTQSEKIPYLTVDTILILCRAYQHTKQYENLRLLITSLETLPLSESQKQAIDDLRLYAK